VTVTVDGRSRLNTPVLATAEHEASCGEHPATAAERGTTGADDTAEHGPDEPESNACDREPFSKESREIDRYTEESRGKDPEEEQAEAAADEAGDGRGQQPGRRGDCSLKTARRGKLFSSCPAGCGHIHALLRVRYVVLHTK
jgi:hypothetical protein